MSSMFCRVAQRRFSTLRITTASISSRRRLRIALVRIGAGKNRSNAAGGIGFSSAVRPAVTQNGSRLASNASLLSGARNGMSNKLAAVCLTNVINSSAAVDERAALLPPALRHCESHLSTRARKIRPLLRRDVFVCPQRLRPHSTPDRVQPGEHRGLAFEVVPPPIRVPGERADDRRHKVIRSASFDVKLSDCVIERGHSALEIF